MWKRHLSANRHRQGPLRGCRDRQAYSRAAKRQLPTEMIIVSFIHCLAWKEAQPVLPSAELLGVFAGAAQQPPAARRDLNCKTGCCEISTTWHIKHCKLREAKEPGLRSNITRTARCPAYFPSLPALLQRRYDPPMPAGLQTSMPAPALAPVAPWLRTPHCQELRPRGSRFEICIEISFPEDDQSISGQGGRDVQVSCCATAGMLQLAHVRLSTVAVWRLAEGMRI